MSKYEKPVRLLFRDFVTDQNIAKGQTVSRDQVVSWFKSNYPKIKMGTIAAHFLKMSVNAPSRVHYNVNQNGEDDLFYQINGGHFRLYEKENDPPPLYVKLSPEKREIEQTGNSEEIEDEAEREYQQTGFAYESDLRDFLSRNLTIIELGLHLYEDEGISGVEFPVGGRFIDLLAMDKHNNYVVIELKVSKGYDRVIGQLLRYMAWIETNQAEPSQKVRGIIIAREISNDLHLAASKIPDVELFEYDLSVSLRKVNKQNGNGG
ncbi:MAG: endonuclease NucS [Anaerolineales bacterium]|nr:endonuclease NucS [Anaerolineales bacterium]